MKARFSRPQVPVLAVALFALAVPLTFAQTFAYTGNLRHDRQFHTSTLLTNGQVLIAAGVNNDGATQRSAELYTPTTGTFAYTGNLQHDRKFHTATLLQSGLVLIAAGENNDGQTLNSAELFNPATGTFAYTGLLQHDRVSFTATLLPSGKVLIAGGYNNSGQTLASAELYNPATGTFSATGSLQHDRALHTATLLANGLVLIAGGFNDDGVTLSSAELYNPTTGTFSYTGSLQEFQPSYLSAVLLPSGQVLTVSYAGVFELYNPTTGGFSTNAAVSVPVWLETVTLLQNGKVLIAGGRNTNSNPQHTVNWAYLYNPTAGTLSSTGPLQHDRAKHTATLLQSGKVLVSAGINNNGTTLNSAELYTPGP